MTRTHARHRRAEAHRSRALGLVIVGAAALAAMTLIAPTRSVVSATPTPADAVAPVGAATSTFTCVGLRQGLQSAVIATSLNDQPVTGTLSVLGQHGVESVRPLRINPHTTYRIALPNRTYHAWSSAVLQWNGGGISVAEALVASGTWTTTPCRSTLSDEWFFGDGVTTLHTGTTLVVANPTPSTAVISARFLTPNGPLEPQALQGVVIPALTTVALPLSKAVVHQSLFATKVTANSGRVVASLVELGLSASQVLTVVQGVTNTPVSSMLAYNVTDPAQVQQFTVTNFSDSPTKVTLSVRLPSGSLPSKVIHLQGSSIGAVDPGVFRGIPRGYPFSISFTSTSKFGVLAIRLARAFPQAIEYRTVETASTLAPAADHLLVIPTGLAGGTSSVSAIGVQSLSKTAITVHFSSLGGAQLLNDVRPPLTLAPRQYVSLSDPLPTAGGRNAIVIDADGPISVSTRAIPGGSPALPGYPAIAIG